MTRTRRTDRGASAVEFALVMIPLLMIIAGIINFGFVFAQQLALDNAVRAGARAGVVNTGANDAAGTNITTVTTREWESTALARGLTSNFTVTFPTGTNRVGSTCEKSTFGKSLAVKGTVTSKFIIPWPMPDSIIPKQLTLTSQAEFQCEYE